MRLNWQNWWFSIFTKLLVMFILVILPVYAIAIQMNESGSQLVSKEISNSLQSQIHFYHTALDKEIDRMIKLQREYVNDKDLLSLSVIADALSDYDRSAQMNEFQYKLNLMKSSGIYVTKASVYIYAGLTKIDNELKKVYLDHNATDAWKLLRYDVGHIETEEMRKESISFLRKWL